MHVEMWPIERVKPYDRNPRQNDGGVEAVARSLREFGFRQPLVVDDAGVVVVGHTRLKAAQSLGMAEVPVHVAAGLTPEQARAYRIADNQTSNLSAWDYEKLRLEAVDLESLGVDLDLLGFGDAELAEIMAKPAGELGDPEEIPEPPKEPTTRPGDLWKLGKHRLLCGDSTVATDVDRLMGGEKADCLWTDPPYNVALGMDETPEQAAKRNRRTDGLTVMNDKMTDGDFRQFLCDVFTNAAMAMRPGAAFYVAHADSEGYNFRGAVRDSGLLLKQCLIWVKSSLVMGRQDYQWRHEPILYGWSDGAAHAWHSDRKQSTVLEFSKPSRNGEHPTMKPVDLVAYCVGNSTGPGQSVLDLFGGSGTTMIACEQLGRRAYLMELDPKYCDVIVARWEKFTGGKAELEARDG